MQTHEYVPLPLTQVVSSMNELEMMTRTTCYKCRVPTDGHVRLTLPTTAGPPQTRGLRQTGKPRGTHRFLAFQSTTDVDRWRYQRFVYTVYTWRPYLRWDRARRPPLRRREVADLIWINAEWLRIIGRPIPTRMTLRMTIRLEATKDSYP